MNRREFASGSLALLAAAAAPGVLAAEGPPMFPKNFYWGTATAAYQVEGAVREDGRGESIWDRFAHTPGKIKDGSTGDVACDHYHRYREDIGLMRAMSLNSYRFSMAWPRILPSGTGQVNTKGLDFYKRVIDELLAAGIRPLPTLYHWDLPQALEDRGGWTNRDMAGWFAEYAAIVARELGDRVGDWILFNEPTAFTNNGYLEGIDAPGRKSIVDFLRATHVVNLAQGAGFRALKAARPKARVGSAFNMSACQAASSSADDKLAAERTHAMMNLWFLEPALHGRYPPAFTFLPETAMRIKSGDMEKTRVPLDFLGINLYYRTIATAASAWARITDPKMWLFPVNRGYGSEGPRTDLGWEVWPDAIYDIVTRMTRDYGRPAIEITETGCAYGEGPDAAGVVKDARRIEFYRGYLGAVARAIRDGADVRGFHAWTLTDNFEWSEGYRARFGLVWVDFATQRRIVKQSGRWYGDVAQANAVL
jgi:beta-glucosidase